MYDAGARAGCPGRLPRTHAGGAYGRDWERRQDEKILEKMKTDGKIKVHPFAERAKLLERGAPVKIAFAREVGADKVLEAVNAVK